MSLNTIRLSRGKKKSIRGWRTIKMGGSGWMTGLDIYSDGTKAARSDVWGAWIYDETAQEWDLLINPTKYSSVPFSKATVGAAGGGGSEIALCDGNTQVVYAVIGSYNLDAAKANALMIKSTDKGTTCAKVDAWTYTMASNTGVGRLAGPKMAVDPNDEDTLWVCSDTEGVKYTQDGGASFSAAPDITVSGIAGRGGVVAFDTSDGVDVNGRTKNIIVGNEGDGVWRSTDAGSSFTQISSSITSFNHIVCTDGHVLIVEDAGSDDDNIWDYTGGSFTERTPDTGKNIASLAVDPDTAGRIVALTESGTCNVGTSYGAGAWGGWNSAGTLDGNGIPYIDDISKTYQSIGRAAFDPNTGRLWAGAGIGPISCSSYASATTDWRSEAFGTELLVGNVIVHPPGRSTPLLMGHDRACLTFTNPEEYTCRQRWYPSASIIHGQHADWASNDSEFVLLFAGSGSDLTATSTDGGTSWVELANKAPIASALAGVNVAVASSTNWVLVAASDGDAWYTKNAGTTWTRVDVGQPPGNTSTVSGTFAIGDATVSSIGYDCTNLAASDFMASTDGLDASFGQSSVLSVTNSTTIEANHNGKINGAADISFEPGWGHSNYTNRHRQVCADRVDIGTFYLLNYHSGRSFGGVWVTTDGGDNWSRATPTGSLTNNDEGQIRMKAVPGNAGHVFITGGTSGSAGQSLPASGLFRYSQDYCESWNTISGFLSIADFSFGPVATGQSYPSIWCIGWNNGTYGLHYSIDGASTWSTVDGYGSSPGYPVLCEADPNLFGRVWVGFANSGFMYYNL